MSHRDSRKNSKKPKPDSEIETLADRFHSMHLHHIPTPVHDEVTCHHKFKHALKKWTGSTRRRHSYSDLCHIQKGTKDPTECKYIIKVFHHDDRKNPALFRHEVRILKDIEEKKLNIIPHLYSLFSCGRYGLVVMDKWDGDLLELIFNHNYASVDHLQRLYHMTRHMLEHLHNAGWSHGRITFHNVIFQMQSEGFRLGLVNWTHAKSLPVGSEERNRILIQKDLNQIDIMFMELYQMIEALKNHESPPKNLPESLMARFQKIE
jgi:hypothetical protein